MSTGTNGGTELIGHFQDKDPPQSLAEIEVNPLIEGPIPCCLEVCGVRVWQFGLSVEGLWDRCSQKGVFWGLGFIVSIRMSRADLI